MFQELSNAKQQDREIPQQFVYRLKWLKAKVLFALQYSWAEFKYDKRLMQDIFFNILYQGLNKKCCNIRLDIMPYISDLAVTDNFILEQVTKLATEKTEKQKRLCNVHKHKPLIVSSSQSQ